MNRRQFLLGTTAVVTTLGVPDLPPVYRVPGNSAAGGAPLPLGTVISVHHGQTIGGWSVGEDNQVVLHIAEHWMHEEEIAIVQGESDTPTSEMAMNYADAVSIARRRLKP